MELGSKFSSCGIVLDSKKVTDLEVILSKGTLVVEFAELTVAILYYCYTLLVL